MGRGGSYVQLSFLQDLADFKAFCLITVNQGAHVSSLLYEDLHKIHTEKFLWDLCHFLWWASFTKCLKKKKKDKAISDIFGNDPINQGREKSDSGYNIRLTSRSLRLTQG